MADEFCISCGTVTFGTGTDESAILVIRSRATGEFLLPKGHKDIGESLQQAAERETFEETGHKASIIPALFPSLATLPAGHAQSKDRELTDEPFAVTGRETDGVLKFIYWFLAVADKTVAHVEGTQQEGEDFDTHWIPVDRIETTLSWPDDVRVAQKAVEIFNLTASQKQ